jgi:predicted transcriptional regulator
MPRNHKLTAVVAGRCVRSTTGGPAKLVILFDDRSTMTVKTARSAATISTGAKVKAVLEDGHQFTLQFEDGSSVTVKLADPGASVAVRDRSSAVEYLG